MPLTRRAFLAGVAAVGFLSTRRPRPPRTDTTTYSNTYSNKY